MSNNNSKFGNYLHDQWSTWGRELSAMREIHIAPRPAVEVLIEPPTLHRPLLSRAVVCCDGSGQGCVLWATGALAEQISEESHDLTDLGLDDAPEGVFVWEGEFVGEAAEPRGEFRRLRAEEWECVKRNRSPW